MATSAPRRPTSDWADALSSTYRVVGFDQRGHRRTGGGGPFTRAAYIADAAAAIEERGIPDATYFLANAVRDQNGWRLATDHVDLMESQREQIGDWWADWLGSSCPILLVRGAASVVLPAEIAQQMVRERPQTRLVEVDHCGHFVHDESPERFASSVADFLRALI